MMIAEVVSDHLIPGFFTLIKDHIDSTSEVSRYSILLEEGGSLVILTTEWDNRDDCLNYHSSRAYRHFVAAAQHMLIGGFVVKVFQNRT
jgi:hypothetical protein